MNIELSINPCLLPKTGTTTEDLICLKDLDSPKQKIQKVLQATLQVYKKEHKGPINHREFFKKFQGNCRKEGLPIDNYKRGAVTKQIEALQRKESTEAKILKQAADILCPKKTPRSGPKTTIRTPVELTPYQKVQALLQEGSTTRNRRTQDEVAGILASLSTHNPA